MELIRSPPVSATVLFFTTKHFSNNNNNKMNDCHLFPTAPVTLPHKLQGTAISTTALKKVSELALNGEVWSCKYDAFYHVTSAHRPCNLGTQLFKRDYPKWSSNLSIALKTYPLCCVAEPTNVWCVTDNKALICWQWLYLDHLSDITEIEAEDGQEVVRSASQHGASRGTSSRTATWIWSCRRSGPWESAVCWSCV